ncbi:MAG: hypothetical protein O7D91_11395 [Planctomycetota bacterium]|nr:hypothetical protein [Planctomycetota bacterium]
MRNFRSVLNQLIDAFTNAKPAHGAVFVIPGGIGLGKTYLLEQFATALHHQAFLARFSGVDGAPLPLEPIYRGLHGALTPEQVLGVFGRGLLEKYVKLIPGFGRFLNPFVPKLEYDRNNEALRRSGVATDGFPSVHIVGFLRDASAGKGCILLFDDCQWLDEESWACFLRVAEAACEEGWVVVAAYDDRAPSRDAKRFAKLRHRAAISPRQCWHEIVPELWDKAALPELCGRILGSRCRLSERECEQLSIATEGVPLYVQSALTACLHAGHLERDRHGVYAATGDWSRVELDATLTNSIACRLEDAYKEIGSARDTLEAASVLGNPFSDAHLGTLVPNRRPFEVLSDVERLSALVRYFLRRREWRFEHIKIRNLVYDTLGAPRARELHHAISQELERHNDVSPLVIAHHLEQAGQPKRAGMFKLKEAERLLESGIFEGALALVEERLEFMRTSPWESTTRDIAHVTLLRAKALYRLSRFKEALPALEEARKDSVEQEAIAEATRWIGRCHLKLDSQRDFESAIQHLETAAELFGRLGNSSCRADTYTDLVVAYAHANRFVEAEQAFKTAETLYNQNADRLGMARLQRRNIMFMDPGLSARIQLRLADTFRELGVPQERIMALNNAASQHIYLGETEEAEDILNNAISESADFGHFGTDYLHNNAAIASVLLGSHENAARQLAYARRYTKRAVLDLILDLTESVVVAMASPPADALPYFEHAYQKAYDIGEYSYEQPACVNLAQALLNADRPREAIEMLRSVRIRRNCTYSRYKHARWFDLVVNCYARLGRGEDLSAFRSEYAWAKSDRTGAYYTFPYAFVSTQFWSD